MSKKRVDITGISLIVFGLITTFLLDIFANIGDWVILPFLVLSVIGSYLTCFHGTGFGMLGNDD